MSIINLVITGCAYANLQIGNASNANTILGGWLYQATASGAGLRVSSANGNVFLGTIMEGNPYGAVIGGGRHTRFSGCWFENNSSSGVYDNELSTVIENSWFSSNGIDIDVQSGQVDAYITKNRFNDGGKITLRSGATRINIYKNINLTTVTDNSAAGTIVKIEDNQGFNPDVVYSVGNITGTTTIDRVNGSKQIMAETANVTFTLANGKAKGDLLDMDITTGGFTQSWPANLKLAGGSCVMTGRSRLIVEWDGTNWVEVTRSLNLS